MPLDSTKGIFMEQIIKQFNESNGTALIVVDVQPEYESGFTFDIQEFTEWLN